MCMFMNIIQILRNGILQVNFKKSLQVIIQSLQLMIRVVWKFTSHSKSAKMVLQPVKSELEIYFEEGAYILGKSIEFSALDWWKANTLKYHVLSIVAKDILSTPIITVTLESTFSAGGRVIDPFRASLSTETVQKLLCGA
jgi:hypothetical protein